MQTLWHDIRYGVRMLHKKPGFALIAVITLALGIGANTAIFSVIDAVILRALPYQEPDRLVFLSERSRQMERSFVAWPNYQDWRAQNRVFEHLGVYNRDSYNLTGDGEPERLATAQVTADVFAALGVGPALGRVFTSDEDRPAATPVVVLSHGLWQRRFGGDPQILNRTIRLNDRAYTVIGVMPAGFQYPVRAELWVSAGQLSGRDWQNRGNHPGLYGVARLKDGVTLQQARADMEAIAVGLEERYPDTNRESRVTVTPLLETIVGEVRGALWVLFAAAGFVLLIGCANVANLLLVRATVRQQEMAIRTALGASRARLIRQLLTESVILALLGSGAAWLLAQWGVDFLVTSGAASLPRANEIHLDSRVLVFTAALSVLTSILSSLAPAWQACKLSIHESLKDRGQGIVAGKQRMRNALVITEMSLALMLLVGAGLLLRSFYHLNHVSPGFNYDHLVSFSIMLPQSNYPSPERRNEFHRALLGKLATLPGVQSAGLASGLPFGASSWRPSFVVEGSQVPPPNEMPLMEACLVSPEFFRAMGVPLRAGRYFTEEENRQQLVGSDLNRYAIVIDEEFAKRYWPNQDAVGKHIRLGPVGPGSPVLTVVGVVGRVKMDRLSVESSRVQCYFSYFQFPFPNFPNMTVVIKSALDPAQIIAAARQQVQSLDPHQPIYNLRTVDQIRADSIAPERLNLTLLVLFAALALLLAAVGIYGIMAYTVAERRQEIGLRMAMGAQTHDILKLVIGQGIKLALVGLAIGLVASVALTRMMKKLLFNVSATDPLTFIVVAALLVAVALLACYLPARRATKVDPLLALRYD